MSRHEPPRWIARLLAAALPPTERGQAILGDLHEEYVLRSERAGRRARLWYAREALGVALRYTAERRRYRRSTRPGERAQRGWEGALETLVTNLRYAVRRLARSPLFTLIAIASLGLGIGANTAMFSLVNAVVLRDQGFENPEALIDVYVRSDGFSHGALSYPDYVDVLEGAADVFSDVGGTQFSLLQNDVDGGVELLTAEVVTGSYFETLGVRAHLGRLLSRDDHVAPGAHPVVVLGHAYWERAFAADPGVVGAELRLSGRPFTVVGVTPESYTGAIRGLVPDIVVPIMMIDALDGNANSILELRGNQSLFAKARLAPGATLVQAEVVLDGISERLRSEYPTNWQASKAFVIVPTADVIMNPMIDPFIVPAAGMVMIVVGLVLLIACANLASFLLARAADRRKEIALRLALGARRRTLIVQLLTETVLLSALGGIAGVWLAAQALHALVAADLPLPLPITLDLSLDRTVLGFSILISAGAGVLFGLVPALQSTNPDVAPTLRDESAGGGRGRGTTLRNMLVSGQVAVSVVLLVAAGLFLRSLDASRRIDPGFGSEPTGIIQVSVPADRYSTEEAGALLRDLADRMRGVTGVTSVGFADNLALNQLNTLNVRIRVDGVEPPAGQDFHLVDHTRIDDGFLETVGIPVLRGRGFEASDEGGERVIAVNEEFVRRFFPTGDAIGRSVSVNDDEARVVGVTRDFKVRQLGEAPRPFVFQSVHQSRTSVAWVLATTSAGGDAERVASEMVHVTRSLDPGIRVYDVRTMRRHLATMLLGRELGALMVSGFALLALLLASIGLYGVVSYAVARRAKEVGIRISLGADTGAVVRMLTGGGMKLVAIGCVIGLVAAAVLAQLLSRLLYGVPALDPLTFVGVPLVLSAVALVAAWVPARRVTRIDPVGALRSE
jgi:predicted permease